MKQMATIVIFGMISAVSGAADKIDDRVVNINTEDREMDAAIAHARATLETFLAQHEATQRRVRFQIEGQVHRTGPG